MLAYNVLYANKIKRLIEASSASFRFDSRGSSRGLARSSREHVTRYVLLLSWCTHLLLSFQRRWISMYTHIHVNATASVKPCLSPLTRAKRPLLTSLSSRETSCGMSHECVCTFSVSRLVSLLVSGLAHGCKSSTVVIFLWVNQILIPNQ